jgi:hypothetical protein
MKKVSEQRMKLRIEYSRETDLIFSDNIPAYADWLEEKLALSQHDVSNSFDEGIKVEDCEYYCSDECDCVGKYCGYGK